MEAQNAGLLAEFEGSAAPPPERVTVTLQMDADLLAWLKKEPLGMQAEINNAVRFIMEMSNAPSPPREAYDAEFETAGPDPARNADKIAHDFVP
jgi:hypothetical protein